jgi:MFS family permease
MAAPEGNRLLTYLLAFLGGIAGALLFYIVTGLAANFVLGLTGMSEREGGRAMVAFFAVAPFGALAGLILGIWLVLHHRR